MTHYLKLNRTRSRKIILAALAVILAYGFWVRYTDLKDKGIFFYDEAYMLLETRYLRDTVTATISRSPEIKTSLANSPGLQLHYGRPGFNGLSLLASYLVGFQDYTNSYLSAFFGAMSVLLVFVIGLTFYGPIAGLLAANFLATFSYHIYYSRLGLPETTGGFFFLVAAFFYLFYLRNLKGAYLLLAGLFSGVAYTFGYRYLLMIGAFLLDQVLKYKDLFNLRKNAANLVKNVLILVGPFLAVLVSIELVFRVVQFFYAASTTETYFGQLRQRFTAVGYFSLQDWTAYFVYLRSSEASIFLYTFLLSLAFWITAALKKWNFAARAVFLLAFLNLIFYTFYSATSAASHGGVFVRFTRSIAVSLPLIALAMGIFVDQILSRLKAQSVLLTILIVIVTFSTQLPKNLEIISLQSGYQNAALYLQSRGENKVFAFLTGPIWRFYLGNENYSPKNVDQLENLSGDKNIHFLAVDTLKYSWSDVPSQNYSYLNSFLKDKTPMATFANNYWGNALVLGEAFDLVQSARIKADPKSLQLQLFRLEKNN